MARTDYSAIIKNHFTRFKQGLFTSLPAKVTAYYPETLSVDVEIVVPAIFDGKVEPSATLSDIPIMFPSSGGGMISFPVEVDDIVLLMFCMRDISAWKEGDGNNVGTRSTRTQDKNDAVAIVGLFAQEQTKPTVPTDGVQIQYKDSTVTLEETKVIIDTSGTVELGSGVIESAVLGESLKAYLDTHIHTGVTTGAGVSGIPSVLTPSSVLSSKVKVE